MVLFGRSRFHVQQALYRLQKASEDLGLKINEAKTEAVKFRRGGRLAADDRLRLNSHALKFVDRFKYLGVTLHCFGKSFTAHITDRCARAVTATNSIPKPHLLSLRTALRLFDLKIAPTASYGIDIIWDKLTLANLETLNKIKATFLRRVLGLHSSSRSRYVFLLANSPLFIEDLVSRFHLPPTEIYKEWIRLWEDKMADVDPQFFNTDAMLNDDWKKPDRRTRHLATRYAIHGFHHRVCSTKSYHDPTELCRCTLCLEPCSRYHAGECRKVTSIRNLDDSVRA